MRFFHPKIPGTWSLFSTFIVKNKCDGSWVNHMRISIYSFCEIQDTLVIGVVFVFQ